MFHDERFRELVQPPAHIIQVNLACRFSLVGALRLDQFVNDGLNAFRLHFRMRPNISINRDGEGHAPQFSDGVRIFVRGLNECRAGPA